MNEQTASEAVTQDTLTDDGVLISAIYPLRNVLMSDGSEATELVGDIVDSEPGLVDGLAEFVESGWKAHGLTDDEDGQPLEEFDDAEKWQQRELLGEWAYRHVPGSLLIAAVETPVPKYCGVGADFSYSWGYTFTGFVAGRLLDELYLAALAWKAARYEAEKQHQLGRGDD